MKGSSLDHPVIVIGDSNAHHLANRTNGGGLAQHLSARLGFLTTYFATPGGVNRICEDFVGNHLPKLTQTKVVILIGRIKDFSGGGWRTPTFPDTTPSTPHKETLQGTVLVRLSEAATIPNPQTADYKDALISAVGTVLKGPHKGQKIKVLTRAMKDRQLIQGIETWRNDEEIRLTVSPMAQARGNNLKYLVFRYWILWTILPWLNIGLSPRPSPTLYSTPLNKRKASLKSNQPRV